MPAKGLRVLAEIGGIEREKPFAQPVETGIAGTDAESELDQRRRAVRYLGPDGFVGQRRLALLDQQRVQRVRQVRRGVGQRAVEIEQHRANLRGHL